MRSLPQLRSTLRESSRIVRQMWYRVTNEKWLFTMTTSQTTLA
jgi:hypothetical protein